MYPSPICHTINMQRGKSVITPGGVLDTDPTKTKHLISVELLTSFFGFVFVL